MTRRRLAELAGGAADRTWAALGYRAWAPMHRRRTFRLGGRVYHYHAHRYNRTWANERTVEVPIVLAALAERPDARTLEVGNVLAHYGVSGHLVVDKYERASGVVNRDVLDFHDERGFDLVVSISTLEHTGFEEEVSDPGKPARVAEHLTGLLVQGGRAILTFPLGYNPALDQLVATRPQALGELRGLRRVSRDNRWVEVNVEELQGARYGAPYASANALVVATRDV